MKIRELLKVLKEKDPEAEVEFVVVKKDGAIVCMEIEGQAHKLAQALKLFGNEPR